MGRPLRRQKQDAIYSITNRTLQQRYFFCPKKKVNQIILGLLAKMAHKYDVELFAFVFMSNHFHLLARSRALKLHLFMRDFQSQLARKLNLYWGRTGKFYERRYSSTEILDDQALVDKLRYTVCNPCESNLVRHPKMWPGLSSWPIHRTGKPLVGRLVNRKVYWSLKRSKKNKDLSEKQLIEKATEAYPLEMAKLPMWEHLDDDSYNERVCELIEEHALELDQRRTVKCVGREDILKQDYWERPDNPKKEPKPICHTNNAQTRQEYIEELREVCDRYRQALGKLREGKSDISFPHGTIPPGHLYCVGSQGAPEPGSRPPGG